MSEKEKIEIASWAIMKGLPDMETLRYSDRLYGREDYDEDIWNYVIECKEIGEKSFKEKYKSYNLYI